MKQEPTTITADVEQRRAARGNGAARTRLLDAATVIIAEGGMGAATSRAISGRAGENLGAVTYYFGSKDVLVSEALVAVARRLIAPIVETLAAGDDPIENMMNTVGQLSALFDDHGSHLPGYVHALAASSHNNDIGMALREMGAEITELLATEIAGQRSSGLIPNWVEPVAMASLIVALANGVAVAVTVDPAGTDIGAIAQQFAALLVNVRNSDRAD